jgi:hypothetical protein
MALPAKMRRAAGAAFDPNVQGGGHNRLPIRGLTQVDQIRHDLGLVCIEPLEMSWGSISLPEHLWPFSVEDDIASTRQDLSSSLNIWASFLHLTMLNLYTNNDFDHEPS